MKPRIFSILHCLSGGQLCLFNGNIKKKLLTVSTLISETIAIVSSFNLIGYDSFM